MAYDTNYYPPAPATDNRLFHLFSQDPNSKFSPALLTAIGTGLLSGNTWNEQLANAGLGANQALATQQQKQQDTATKNQTVAFLQQNAPDLATNVASGAIDSKTALTQYWERQKAEAAATKPDYGFMNVNGQLVRYDKRTGQTDEVGNYADPNAKLTSDEREYQRAKDEGFNGTFMDYQVKMREAGRSQVNIDNGEKLPTGFRWIDPNNHDLGVKPIPGGPGEQLPGELAARIGMAEDFQKKLPNIKVAVKKGEVTGAADRAWIDYVGTGDGANTFRDIQGGVDALQRLLTGAGMNKEEAAQYARRYLPSYTDSVDSVNSKLDDLNEAIESAKSKAMRGRGGNVEQPNTLNGVMLNPSVTNPASAQDNDPLGIRK